jgi:hypothetical protein
LDEAPDSVKKPVLSPRINCKQEHAMGPNARYGHSMKHIHLYPYAPGSAKTKLIIATTQFRIIIATNRLALTPRADTRGPQFYFSVYHVCSKEMITFGCRYLKYDGRAILVTGRGGS